MILAILRCQNKLHKQHQLLSVPVSVEPVAWSEATHVSNHLNYCSGLTFRLFGNVPRSLGRPLKNVCVEQRTENLFQQAQIHNDKGRAWLPNKLLYLTHLEWKEPNKTRLSVSNRGNLCLILLPDPVYAPLILHLSVKSRWLSNAALKSKRWSAGMIFAPNQTDKVWDIKSLSIFQNVETTLPGNEWGQKVDQFWCWPPQVSSSCPIHPLYQMFLILQLFSKTIKISFKKSNIPPLKAAHQHLILSSFTSAAAHRCILSAGCQSQISCLGSPFEWESRKSCSCHIAGTMGQAEKESGKKKKQGGRKRLKLSKACATEGDLRPLTSCDSLGKDLPPSWSFFHFYFSEMCFKIKLPPLIYAYVIQSRVWLW